RVRYRDLRTLTEKTMKAMWIRFFVAGFGALVLTSGLFAGGRAIVTVGTLPEYGVAGKPLRLNFMVRDPGLTPREDFTPAIAASSGTELVRAAAAPTRKVGEYQATLLFPHPGRWTIRINSFGDEDLSQWGLAEGPTLPQFTVIAPGDPI